ncbi:hypothetical protein PJL18_04366 [Paenarthrobacter nicotinovorans]|nr:hypothetical protein [Paenarthrobacter nicotinovorans]
MELVGELVGLRAQGVRDRTGGTKFALKGGQLGAVPQGGHRTDVAPMRAQRHPVHHHQPLPYQHQLVRVRLFAGQHHFQGGFDGEGAQLPAYAVVGQSEQLAGALVGHRDPLMGVQRHNTFLEALQHGFAVFHQSGDFPGFHAEGLPFDTTGQEKRTRHPQDAGHSQVGEEVGNGVAESFQGGRVVAADGCDADHLPGVVDHRHVGGQHCHVVAGDDAGPGPAFHHPALSQWQGPADQSGVRGRDDCAVQFCQGHVR